MSSALRQRGKRWNDVCTDYQSLSSIYWVCRYTQTKHIIDTRMTVYLFSGDFEIDKASNSKISFIFVSKVDRKIEEIPSTINPY